MLKDDLSCHSHPNVVGAEVEVPRCLCLGKWVVSGGVLPKIYLHYLMLFLSIVSNYLQIYLSIYLSVCLSVCLPISIYTPGQSKSHPSDDAIGYAIILWNA